MKIAVWDTYVEKEDGSVMHFDILVPATLDDKKQVIDLGNRYLLSKSLPHQISSTDRCDLCHIEKADQVVIEQIIKKGYSIVELANCD